MTSDPIDKVALAIFKSTFHPDDAANDALVAEKRIEWKDGWRRAERAAIAALRAIHPTLEAARDEILWWRDEHPCCAGHETETLDAINQVLEANPNTGREG